MIFISIKDSRLHYGRRLMTWEITGLTPVKTWMLAAKLMLAGALLSLLAFVSPAFAAVDLDALVPQIIMAESSGRASAEGDGGKARGLMQIQKDTWERFSGYSWDEAYNPEKNVQVGRKILEYILESYGDRATKKLVIYTYNTGKWCGSDDELPKWTLHHPNKIYRSIFNETE